MKNIIWVGSLALILVTTAASLSGAAQSISAIEHTLSIYQRPDGSFDVTCLDGKTEVKSQDDVLANRLCTHLKTYIGRWTLMEGGIDNGSRFCDLDLNLIRSNHTVLKLKAAFAPPCAAAVNETQECGGLLCSLQLGGKYFSFDFTTESQVTLTRLQDGFTAIYRGNAGSGGSGFGTARLTELSGVENILQTTSDGGATWRSVCDDNFNQEEAMVACRELGFSGQVISYDTGIVVSGDVDFGWDDLVCKGSEASLADCTHPPFGSENCGAGEHVQLECAP